jgi:hypothetical protein
MSKEDKHNPVMLDRVCLLPSRSSSGSSGFNTCSTCPKKVLEIRHRCWDILRVRLVADGNFLLCFPHGLDWED